MFTDQSINKFYGKENYNNPRRYNSMDNAVTRDPPDSKNGGANGVDAKVRMFSEREEKLRTQAQWREELQKQVEEKKIRLETEKREKIQRDRLEEERLNKENAPPIKLKPEVKNVPQTNKVEEIQVEKGSPVKHYERLQRSPVKHYGRQRPQGSPTKYYERQRPQGSSVNQYEKQRLQVNPSWVNYHSNQNSLQSLIDQLKDEARKSISLDIKKTIKGFRSNYKPTKLLKAECPPKLSACMFEDDKSNFQNKMKKLRSESTFLPLSNAGRFIVDSMYRPKAEYPSVEDDVMKDQLNKLDLLLVHTNQGK